MTWTTGLPPLYNHEPENGNGGRSPTSKQTNSIDQEAIHSLQDYLARTNTWLIFIDFLHW